MAGGIKGITVKIGGDTTELGRSLSEATTKSTNLQKELKGVNTLLKFDPKNVDLLKQKSDLLKQAISETKTKLNDLVEVQRKVDAGEIEMTEAEYRNLQREIANTKIKLADLEQQQKQFGSVGAQRVAQVGESFQSVGAKLESAGKALAPFSAIAGSILAGSIASAMELDTAYDTIITKTGATGETLADLKEQAEDLFTSLPISASDAGIAIGEVNTRFGLTGDALEDISAEFLKFANINGTDLNGSIDDVSSVMAKFGLDASQVGNVLGLLTKTGQNTGISMETLLNTLNTNGAVFKEMGLDITGATALLAQFEMNGIDSSTAIAGLKKAQQLATKQGKDFSTVLTDGVSRIKDATTETEAMQIATELFGKKAGPEMAQAIREGRLSVEDLMSSLEDYGDVVDDTYEATLSPWDEMKVALNNVKLAGSELAGEFFTALRPVIDSLVVKVKALTERFKNLSPQTKRTIATVVSLVAVLSPVLMIVGKLTSGIGSVLKLAPKIVSALSTISAPMVAIVAIVAALIAAFVHLWKNNEGFRDKITSIWDGIKAKFSSFGASLKQRLNDIGIEFDDFGELLSKMWTGLCDFLGPVFVGVFDAISIVIGTILDAIINIFDIFSAVFSGDWSGAWEGVKKLFSGIWTGICNLFSTLLETLKNAGSVFLSWFGLTWDTVWTSIKTFFSNIWTGITTFFSNAVTTIKTTAITIFTSVKTFIVGIWNGIKTAVSNVVTTIVTAVTTAWTNIKTAVITVGIGIKTAVTNAWNGVKTATTTAWETIKTAVSTVITTIKTTISTVWTSIKTSVTTIVNGIKTSVSTAWTNIKTGASIAWTGIKTAIMTPINAAKTAIGTAITGIKTTLSTAWTNIKTGVSTAWNSIKTAITTPINDAKTAIGTAISGIKTTVRNIFTGIVPKLKLSLPKVSVSGGKAPWGIAGKGELPSFNVTWNKLGAIFKKPTIFETASGLQGVGEAGPEAVAPISELMSYVRSAVNNSEISDRIERVEKILSDYLPGIASGRNIVLDTGELVGSMVGSIDVALGNRNNQLTRGW